MSDIEMGTVYDMNKQLVQSQEKQISKYKLGEKKKEIISFLRELTAENSNCAPSEMSASGVAREESCESGLYIACTPDNLKLISVITKISRTKSAKSPIKID